MASSYKIMDDDDKESANRPATCFSGPFRMDIKKAAYAISFFGCALGLIKAVEFLLTDSGPLVQHRILLVSSALLFAAIYLSISVAQWARNRLILWPYLICQGLYLVITLIGCIGFYAMATASPQWAIDAWNKQHPEAKITKEQYRMMMYSVSLAMALSLIVCGWFYSIVYRVYKHMAHMVLGQ